MAVIAHVVLRGVDRATYDKVRTECGWLDNVPAGDAHNASTPKSTASNSA